MSLLSRARSASRRSAKCRMSRASSSRAMRSSSTASTGEVHVRPQPDVQHRLCRKGAFAGRAAGAISQLRDVPPSPRTAWPIELHMNAGLARRSSPCRGNRRDVDRPVPHRTAIHDRLRNFPRMQQQYDFYRPCSKPCRASPITFRTLDIGSDKVLPYMTKSRRRIRLSAGAPSVSVSIARPAAHAVARVVARRRRARAAHHVSHGRDVARIRRGEGFGRCASSPISIDTATSLPASSSSAPCSRCPRCCGSSTRSPARRFPLGRLQRSLQYLFAADRDNKRVVQRFDSLSPPLLRALEIHRRDGRARRHAGHALRRDGWPSARGAGAAGDRLPLAVDVAVLDRPGEGDAAGRRSGEARVVSKRFSSDQDGATRARKLLNFARREWDSRCRARATLRPSPRPSC